MSSFSSSHPMSRFSTGRIALLITLGTESVFFITLLVAYAALRDVSGWDLPRTLTRLALPLVNSGVLLLSAVTAGWSLNAIQREKPTKLNVLLLTTLLLGLLFVAGQVFEFSHSGLRIDDPTFGGVFFTLMGFHALHVLAGVVFISLNLLRARLGDFSAQHHEAVLLGTWFWYYVTAVWLVLFSALYLV